MKKIIAILAIVVSALVAGSCSDISNDGGNSAVANTTWRLNSPNDEVYHQDVVYTVKIGKGNEISFTRNIGGTDTVMKGTYTYNKSGQGTCYVRYTTGSDTSDYRFKFTVSGNVMEFTFNLRTIVLTKV